MVCRRGKFGSAESSTYMKPELYPRTRNWPKACREIRYPEESPWKKSFTRSSLTDYVLKMPVLLLVKSMAKFSWLNRCMVTLLCLMPEGIPCFRVLQPAMKSM
jgi:hypothetical protein